MTRRLRILLGLLILFASLVLLAWGYLPVRRETRIQPIPPADLQLPTPISFCPDLAWFAGAVFSQPILFA